jgi:predicted nucleic acid-binding protein
MSNKILLDSSVLIEYYKGAKTELLEALLLDISAISLLICQTTLSEHSFQCLKTDSGKAPLTLKSSGAIAETPAISDHQEFLHLFEYLPDGPSLRSMCPAFMSKYNLLPNDALILSLCKSNDIRILASYDANDFQIACAAEGITLLQTPADWAVLKALK